MKDWKSAGRMECVSGISTMLSALAANIKINSKSNRNDLAVISEHTICGLLNRMYGWNLRNANTPKHPNFPSVDLVDEEAGVAIQVTVDNSVKKVDHTLEKFKEYKLNRTFNRLILMVITIDEPTAAMKNREDGCFYGLRDIWNITTLTKEIEQEKDVGKLRNIAEYLEKELGFGFFAPGPQTVQTTEIKVVDAAGETSLETHILRDDDTGDFGTRIMDHAGDKSYQTTILEKETDGTKTVETTILIQDQGGANSGNGDTVTEVKEPKETLLQIFARKREERKRKRLEKKAAKKAAKKAEKQEKPDKKLRKWWVLLLIPVAVAALVLLKPEVQLKEMPPELVDYSVTINGEKISLPITLAKLEEMGWVLKDAEKYLQIQVDPHKDYAYYGEDEFWSGSATLTNGYGTIDVRMGNGSNHTVPFEECVVYELTFNNSFDASYTGEAVNTLEGPMGLTWKQSSYRDVKWPAGYEKEKNSYKVSYTYQLDVNHRYTMEFDRKTQKLKYLVITNRDEATMAELVGAAYDTQAPEYDAEALAEFLGVTMRFRFFHPDSSCDFPVGVPMAEYQNLGYTVDKQPEFVVSYEQEDVYFRCDTLNQLQADVYNPFHRALTPEACFIGKLDTRDMETDGSIRCMFSDGEKGTTINLGMSAAILKAELDKQNISFMTGEGNRIIIYPNRSNRDITITCLVSEDTGNIIRIQADLCEALRKFMEQEKYRNNLEEKFEGIG